MRTNAVVAGAVLAAIAAGAQAQEAKWGPHIDTEGRLGSKRSLGEADLFMPVAQDAKTLLFANLRTRFDSGGGSEGNLGLGARRMLDSGWNLGLYGYADRRRSDNGRYYNQTTFGAEALGRDFDFRANLYTPFGTRVRQVGEIAGNSSAAISGTSVLITTTGAGFTEERALKGFDAEAGWRLPFFDAEARRQFRVFLGGYRFSDDTATLAGPRARAEFELADPGLWHGSRLTAGLKTQHDGPRGTQTFAVLRLRIPLGGAARAAPLNFQERRMADPVVRDVDVVTQTRSVVMPAFTETAVAGGQNVVVLSSATTTDLPAAVAAAGAGSTVVLTGAYSATSTVAVATGQTLMGAGPLTVKSPSGRTAVLAAPGASVDIVTTSASLLTMGSDSTLNGLTITGHSTTAHIFSVGIAASGNGLTISNNTVTVDTSGIASGPVALQLSNVTNSTVSGNALNALTTNANAEQFALQLGLGTRNVLITGNTLRVSGGLLFAAAVLLDGGIPAPGSDNNTIIFGNCQPTNNAVTPTIPITFTGSGPCP